MGREGAMQGAARWLSAGPLASQSRECMCACWEEGYLWSSLSTVSADPSTLWTSSFQNVTLPSRGPKWQPMHFLSPGVLSDIGPFCADPNRDGPGYLHQWKENRAYASNLWPIPLPRPSKILFLRLHSQVSEKTYTATSRQTSFGNQPSNLWLGKVPNSDHMLGAGTFFSVC